MTEITVPGEFYVEAGCEGEVIKTPDPISFWGGYDPAEGRIIDGRNEACGERVTGKIFLFPEGVGSSTTAAVLLESVRNSTHPLGIVNVRTEPILVTGALIARELYGVEIPIVSIEAAGFEGIDDGDWLKIDPESGSLILRG